MPETTPARPAPVKTCTSCSTRKPLSDLNRQKQARNGYRSECRPTSGRAYRQRRRQTDPQYIARKKLRQNFGLTLEQREDLFAAVGYRCESCGTHRDDTFNGQLVLDHDHNCCPTERTCGGCIRGVLCTKCNVAFGALNDDIARVDALAAYARRTTNA